MIKNKADKVTKNGVENDDNNSDEESGEVLFYVNKNGFPVGQSTWERMWNHAGKVHPAGIKPMGEIREDKDLSKVTIPTAPTFQPNTSIPCRLDAVQDYMKELQYNHTGTQFFEIRKNRPISGLMDSAKEMIRESLPIKCLEAVILSLYLTNGAPGLERFPLSFKTHFSGTIHRHVVLAVYYSGRYGALGMSRRDDLMYKPLEFKSLSELVFDFEDVYKKYWHTVRKVKIGLPVSHDPHSFEQIQWRTMSVSPSKQTRSEVQKEIEKFTKDLKSRFKWSSSYSSYQFVKENTRLNYEPTSPRKSISSSLTSKTPRKDSQASGSKETTPLSPGAVRACDSSDEEAEGVSPTPAAKKGAAIDYQIRI
ncbi:tubulinyl-Tyr carboxypeptidase 2-like [Asterias amurensis]|uniref:tubulinyl-Tyr carboxypeptidase 2-like n=1 Tax=Asterias amurensis TaxID=7602 RepID=UPI003AB8937C